MLEAVELSKSYGDHLALDHLNLKVTAGEIFCLLGANGAGKTTTINLFLDFIKPTAGHARVDGMEVTARSLETKNRLAYIPEQVMLYANLTGMENLAYFCEIGGHKEYSRTDYRDFLKKVNLPEEAIDRRMATYSKGMRQKVGIAIALARRAKALLLDEPTSGLDPQASREFAELLERMREEGTAVLMTTHDIFRARETGQRVGIMKHGVLVETISTDQISTADLEQIYIRVMRD
jgi:ABC-2 type transport system ATP-binding protein